MYEALDEDTRRQLNRVEAMLNAICFKEGIETSTLPGYELSRSVSPSSQSVSSTSIPVMTLTQIARAHFFSVYFPFLPYL